MCYYINMKNIRFNSRKLVYNVGENDFLGPISHKGVKLKSYKTWLNMLSRVYGNNNELTTRNYCDVTVCSDWLKFSNFKEFFDKNYIEGYELDKDLISKDNKTYGPDFCCFVPRRINLLIIKSDNTRGKYPVGIHIRKDTGKYVVQLRRDNLDAIRQEFTSIEEAFNFYKISKENYIKEVANEYKQKNLITDKVYEALINYEVLITD